jgi:hypothetical protein
MLEVNGIGIKKEHRGNILEVNGIGNQKRT